MRCLLIAAWEMDVHWATYCSRVRIGILSPLYFSNVMPAAMNPFAGTVSP
jgi:hypothetical protein